MSQGSFFLDKKEQKLVTGVDALIKNVTTSFIKAAAEYCAIVSEQDALNERDK